MTDVAVVALGKIGLPLAVAIAGAGHRVRGVDINQTVVDLVNDAVEPFPGEADLDRRLSEVVSSGKLTASTDTAAAVAQCQVVIIVVPLIVDAASKPDYTALDAATRAVADGLQPCTLVSYETTMPVGTTRDRFGVALAEQSGLELGTQLHVVHSPERVYSGRIFEDLAKYPKLVGGLDDASTQAGIEFYESFLEFDQRPDLDRPNGVWPMVNAEAAELAKLAETTYRDINIAYANELALASVSLCIDVYEVISACNSQPFSHIHRPGIAVGGHCIPVYPHFMLNSVDGLRLPALAREVNDSMPEFVVEQLVKAVGPIDGLTVLILGVAYRSSVKEHAFSGVFETRNQLEQRGATVVVHDPLYNDAELKSLGLSPMTETTRPDAAVLHTDHPEYLQATSADFGSPQVTVDGRAVLDSAKWAGLVQLGRP